MSLLKMSFSGAVMILAIVVIRSLAINSLPKKTFLALWDIALTRLLIPYWLPSAFSVYSLLGRLTSPAETGGLGTGAAVPPVTVLPLPDPAAVSSVPSSNASCLTIEPHALVWTIGVLACAVFFITAHLKCRRKFRESLPVDNDYAESWLHTHQLRRTIAIRQSDRISAPLTYGIFHPVILLPKHTDWKEKKTLAYVLAHEYIHIRRFDAVSKLALTAALCIHWFNPAVWFMYVLANRDIELSCDEAVVRLFGEHTKSAYAMALIRMEETRSGLKPLCNHFSKHAIKERIIAIMKIKKNSKTTVFAALTLIVGVTSTFATTGQTAAARDSNVKTAAGIAQTVEDAIVFSYSFRSNDGETWTPMTDEDLRTAQMFPALEWWTAEEYAADLEQEKRFLPSIIGEQAWTPSDGWFTWTQEMADELIARREQTLRDIQNGLMLSKPTADGGTIYQFGCDPASMQTMTDSLVSSSTFVTDAEGRIPSGRVAAPELLAEYQACGLTYDEQNHTFFFNGEQVRYFFDGYDTGNGIATIYEYMNEEGSVDVHTLRQATANADGSTNPRGKLEGIRPYSQEEFDNRIIVTRAAIPKAAAFGG